MNVPPASDPVSVDLVRPIAQIDIEAPLRLHFGLLPLGNEGQHRHGGLGVMVSHPSLHLTIRTPDRTTHPDTRVEQCATRYCAKRSIDPSPAQIECIELPEPHIGLGSGTQLAISIGTLLSLFHERRAPTPLQIAEMMGRGMRSLVGTTGFERGGVIWDNGLGDLPGSEEAVDSRHQGVSVHCWPREWCLLLIRRRDASGLSGSSEQVAFGQLSADGPRRARLIAMAEDVLLPALARGAYDSFCNTVYEFGMECGATFKHQQGGECFRESTRDIVQRLRSDGLRGVGQSSWGPSVYAIFPTRRDAKEYATSCEWLKNSIFAHSLATAADAGAQVTVCYEDE